VLQFAPVQDTALLPLVRAKAPMLWGRRARPAWSGWSLRPICPDPCPQRAEEERRGKGAKRGQSGASGTSGLESWPRPGQTALQYNLDNRLNLGT
jgi:hypothetical protein